MRYLLVKNWREYQHYKQRTPPWIKLHRAVIDDYLFAALKDRTKAHLIMIWVLASASEGRIPHDAKFIGARINANEPVDIEAMIEAGFLLYEDSQDAVKSQPEEPNPANEKNAQYRLQASEIITFLNSKAERNFDLNGANADFVIARLKDGESMDDLRAVIAKKCREWKGDEKMHQFLRPATLFNRSKFASYKGELVG